MNRIKLIAECANYWHGEDMLLQSLCIEAIAAQCDYFKLQMYNPEMLGNAWQSKKPVYVRNEITSKRLVEIKDMCDMYGIELLGTVNTPDRVDLLAEANVYNVKIASGQIHPFLIDKIAKRQWEKIFVSTGMMADAEDLNKILPLFDCSDEVIIMHCVSLYPTHDSESNLLRIRSLQEAFPNATMGYSDHSMDDLACVVAMGMGARYIEKHIKVESCWGATSEIASDPVALRVLSMTRKRVERMLGDGRLSMQERELASAEHYAGRYLLKAEGGKPC